MKTRIELTIKELKLVANALHFFRSAAESLHLQHQIEIENMDLIEIERIRRIFSDKFYRLIEKNENQ